MNRRAFLASLAAALVLDPERALWVPGKKLISAPNGLRGAAIERPLHAKWGYIQASPYDLHYERAKMMPLRKPMQRAIEPHIVSINRYVIMFDDLDSQRVRRFEYLIETGRQRQAVDEGLGEWSC